MAGNGLPWAGLVRVSHLGGRGGDSFHADSDQVADLEREADRIGGRLVMLEPELDISGGLPLEQRPSLLAAIEGVERGEYAGIIVSYLSRFGRSIREQLRAWDRVEAAGGRIIVVREQIDSSTAAGRLQRNLLLSIAEHEREQHAERFEDRRRLATQAGIWQRRQTPAGYRRDPQTRRLVPDERAPLVQRAFRARGAGATISGLADELQMTSSGVRQLLKNRVYLGELRVGEHVNPSAHEPLVDEDVWLAAQSSIARPARRVGAGPALLAGIVRCQGCGHVMIRGRSSGHDTYSCHARHSAGRCPSPSAIRCHALDEHVERLAILELEQITARAAETGGQLASARDRVRAAESELAAYLQAVSASDVGAEAFAAGARGRREEIDEARARLSDLLASRGPALDVTATGVWDQLDVRHRNRVLRGLLEVVIVRAAGRGRKRPVEERCRVVVRGAGIVPTHRGGGAALPIRELAWPDLSDPVVLGP